MEDKDYCTGFPEYWWTWKGEYIYIGNLCKEHDNNDGVSRFKGCSNTKFFNSTWRARLIGAVIIATVASIMCFIKFPKRQSKRI